MKKLFILVLVLLIVGITVNASHSAQYWAKTYGGSKGDCTSSIQQTMDGGYIVNGDTNSFGANFNDIWVLKFDGNGDIIWQKFYGGEYQIVSPLQQTLDGGYIMIALLLVLEARGGIWREYGPYLELGITLAGSLYSIYLTYLEVAVIHAICPYCVVSAVVIILLFILSIARLIIDDQEFDYD